MYWVKQYPKKLKRNCGQMSKISKNIIIKSMIESSVVKEVFLPTEGVAFAADISMTSRIPYWLS